VSRHDWAAAPLPVLEPSFVFPSPRPDPSFPSFKKKARSFRTDGLDRATPPCPGPREGSDAPGFLIPGHRHGGVGRASGRAHRSPHYSFPICSAPCPCPSQTTVGHHHPHPAPAERSGGGAIASTSAARRRARGCPGRGGLQGLLFLGGVPSCQAKVSLVLSPSRHSFCFSVVK